jgi:hypothetical protein
MPGFFDNISHEKLMELMELRIADRRILRLIRKWLTAGVSPEAVAGADGGVRTGAAPGKDAPD